MLPRDQQDKKTCGGPDAGIDMNLGPEGLLVWQIRSENSRQKEDSRKEEAEKHRKESIYNISAKLSLNKISL